MFEDILNRISIAANVAGDTVTTASSAFDLAKKIGASLRKTKGANDLETRDLISSLIDQIQDTKMANQELKDEIIQLRTSAIEAQRLHNEFDRYQLETTQTGAVVLALKKERANNEPLHYICPTCRENGKKAILQGHEGWRKCNTCSAEYLFKPRTIQVAKTNQKSFWDY